MGRLLAVPCSTLRSWRAASKAPAGLPDGHPRSLLVLPPAQVSAQLWYPLEVPSLPLTQTASLQAEEDTGPGARGHGASAGPRSILTLLVRMRGNEMESCLLEPRINMLLVGFLNPALCFPEWLTAQVSARSPSLLYLPTLSQSPRLPFWWQEAGRSELQEPGLSPAFLESLVEMEGLPPSPFESQTQTPGFRSQAALFGKTHDTWVWFLHADTLRGDMSFLPKALRSSQAPERRAQALPSSGTQPFVVPGTPGVSAKP